jgi:putative tryptophan/tyrosine transport system substrate-binding protein
MFAHTDTPLDRRQLLMAACCLVACTPAPPVKTVGIVNYMAALQPTVDGLKAGLNDLGQADGHQVRFVFNGLAGPDLPGVEAEVRKLIEQKVDVLFVVGTPPAQAARKLMGTSGPPVVFAPLMDPVGFGVVNSLTETDPRMTGVHNANLSAKAVEWMKKIVPQARQVHIFHSGKDAVSDGILKALALQTILPVTGHRVTSSDEALAMLPGLPAGASMLVVPTPSLSGLLPVQAAALARGIPVGAYNMPADNALFAYSVDWYRQGRQAARLVDRLLKGATPAQLPIEAAESYLTLNLSLAARHRFNLPDAYLAQADQIVR